MGFGAGAAGTTSGTGLLGGPSQPSIQEKQDPFSFNNDRPFGQNMKQNEIGSGLGSGFGGAGMKFGAEQDKPKFGNLSRDPLGGGAPGALGGAQDASSGSEYEEDFEPGESIANLGKDTDLGKGPGKKGQPDFDLDDFFAPGKANGKDKPSDKDSEPPAFDDDYDFNVNF